MTEWKRKPVEDLAIIHFKYSLLHDVCSAYEGEHWLSTLALLAIRNIEGNPKY
jgi:hypothetical protein